MSDFTPIGQCGPARYFQAATVLRGQYPYDGTTCLVANPYTENRQVYTVCLGGDPVAPQLTENQVWIKDWSENEGVLDALVEAGLVRPTGLVWPTGFCFAIQAELLV